MPSMAIVTDAPQYSLWAYERIVEYNNGYQYAIDHKNDVPGIKSPGSFQFRNPKFSNSELIELQRTISLNSDPSAVCEALSKLLNVDGADMINDISPQELRRPLHHYFAVVLQKVPGEDGSFVAHVSS